MSFSTCELEQHVGQHDALSWGLAEGSTENCDATAPQHNGTHPLQPPPLSWRESQRPSTCLSTIPDHFRLCKRHKASTAWNPCLSNKTCTSEQLEVHKLGRSGHITAHQWQGEVRKRF
eukprot:4264518-Amphidinium_carterae.1